MPFEQGRKTVKIVRYAFKKFIKKILRYPIYVYVNIFLIVQDENKYVHEQSLVHTTVRIQ